MNSVCQVNLKTHASSHGKQTRSLNLPKSLLQWFTRFVEFSEFKHSIEMPKTRYNCLRDVILSSNVTFRLYLGKKINVFLRVWSINAVSSSQNTVGSHQHRAAEVASERLKRDHEWPISDLSIFTTNHVPCPERGRGNWKHNWVFHNKEFLVESGRSAKWKTSLEKSNQL